MREKKPAAVVPATSRAVDLLYFPKAHHSWGEGRCREPIEPVVERLKQSKVAFVFVTQCKQWSCDRRIYCYDFQLDDILRYTFPYPNYFIGIAGYNPLEIGASVQEAEIGIRNHGFRGIYVHPGSFGIALNDRRMYPLYVKALEWQVPVILDLEHLERETHWARPADINQVAGDFSELNFVVTKSHWTGDEMLRLADDLSNLYFCFDNRSLFTPAGRTFIESSAGQSRCMWGSNGLPWEEALSEVARLKRSVASRLLRENAVQLFHLEHLPKTVARPFVEPDKPPLRIVAE